MSRLVDMSVPVSIVLICLKIATTKMNEEEWVHQSLPGARFDFLAPLGSPTVEQGHIPVQRAQQGHIPVQRAQL